MRFIPFYLFASVTCFFFNFDWFTVLSVSFVIGESDYFGFGFTILNGKPLLLSVKRTTNVSCPLHLKGDFSVVGENFSNLSVVT